LPRSIAPHFQAWALAEASDVEVEQTGTRIAACHGVGEDLERVQRALVLP
jgi:hypothetical protein